MSKYGIALASTTNMLFAFLQMLLTCLSQLSKILTPREFPAVIFAQKQMTFISVSFHLVISKQLKHFLSKILQRQIDISDFMTDVISDIVGKIYIIDENKQSNKKILIKIVPSMNPCVIPTRISPRGLYEFFIWFFVMNC